jgi:hypothetical protein
MISAIAGLGRVVKKYLPVLIILLISGADSLAAQLRCEVADPTGTPLNVRTLPAGNIIGTLTNVTAVTVLSHAALNGKT